VKAWRTDIRSRDWIILVAAIAIGPVFIKIGYAAGLVYGTAALAYFLCCLIVVPALTILGGRLKYFTWQLAIMSLTFAVIGDNLRLNAINRSEIPRVAFAFWAMGTLLSSPAPTYFLLRGLKPRQRYVAGIAIAALALALWVGLKRITG
jgi:hypothetical protein